MLTAMPPSHDQHVVDQGDDGGQTERHALEPNPEIDDDADPACNQGVDSHQLGIAGHRRADIARCRENRTIGDLLLERLQQRLGLLDRQQHLQAPLVKRRRIAFDILRIP